MYSPTTETYVDGMVAPTTQAVIWVKKAANGSLAWPDKCTQEQFEWYMLFKKTRKIDFAAKVLLIFLAFFELPTPCGGTPEQCAHANMTLYSWSLPVIPLRIRMAIAFVLYLIVGGRLFARRKALGEHFEFVGWRKFQCICVFVGCVFCIITFVGAKEGSLYWLIAMLCRPLTLIGGTKKLRSACDDIRKSVTDGVALVIATLFLSIWVFVWVGMILFARTPEGKKSFFSWADACASMWILFTTANDPNDWMAAYSTYRLSVFFFIIFLVLMLYLLMNLLVANVYQSYKNVVEEDLERKLGESKNAIGNAFLCICDSNDSTITPMAWGSFLRELCDPYIGKIHVGDSTQEMYNLGRCHRIIKMMCSASIKECDNQNGMAYPAFEEIILTIISREPAYIPSPQDRKHAYFSCCPSSMTSFFEEGFDVNGVKVRWDRIVDTLILIAMPIAVWASVTFAAAKDAVEVRSFLSFRLLFLLACVYTVGLTVKIFSLGYERFWYRNKIQHRFDFFNVYLLIIASLAYFFIWPAQWLARVIIILHIFRGFRLLAYFEPLRNLYQVSTFLIPQLWQMFLVLFVLFYLFAVVGQYWFGGLIFNTNPVLANTNFASSYFWTLNFNDLPSGFVTLFALMIVNNWYEIAQGFMFVTHSNLAAAYFLVFFVICNLIVLNIVMALVIDCNGLMAELATHETRILDKELQAQLDVEAGEVVGSPRAEYMLRKAFNLETSDRTLLSPQHSDSEEDVSRPFSRPSMGSVGSERQKTTASYNTFGEWQQGVKQQYKMERQMERQSSQ